MHSSSNVTPITPEAVRRVSWGAIFAGTVVAMALMIFFSVLGIAIGAAAIDPMQDESMSGLGWGSALYLIITQILSLLAGGFAASRLAGVPRFTASVLHGAAVWALCTVLLTWAAATGAGAAFNAASSALNTAAQGASNVAKAIVPDDVSFPNLPDLAGQISIEDLPDPIQATLEENNITLSQLQREARQAMSQVVSEQETQRAIDLMQSTVSDVLSSPTDIVAELNEALDRLITGPDAIISQEDRQEALRVMEQRLGLERAETEQIMQVIENRTEQAIAQVRQAIDEAQQQVEEAADAAASAISSTAWWVTLASLLALTASIGGAILGKPDGLLGDRLDDRYS